MEYVWMLLEHMDHLEMHVREHLDTVTFYIYYLEQVTKIAL